MPPVNVGASDHLSPSAGPGEPGIVGPGDCVQIVNCHAEGEVGDVIVDGVAPPPGDTLWAQAQWIARDGRLRRHVLNEPRGGVFRHVNLLLPPKHPEAVAAFLIMEPADTPPMSGSNAICVATVLLETGRVPMVEPITEFKLEAPGGLVAVSAECAAGKARAITVHNVPCCADRIDAPLEVPGVGTLQVDTAYGGDSFVIVDAQALGLRLRPDEASTLCELGVRLTEAANEQLGFRHPINTEINRISFCQFALPIARESGHWVGRNAVVIRPGKVDRSPTGTGLSARLAVLAARGEAGPGDTLIARSIIGSEFRGRIEETLQLGDRSAIRPSIRGRAWITGSTSHQLDATDPFPLGYRLSDTWPGAD